ncbi:MAG: WbqC family protein [Bacteroidales bacterium]|nr:WbqC family protein [Bacteroidales bacterium]
MTPLLSTAFCPPIEYFAVLAGYSSVYMEACESYAKQSWRNRCRILTANGPQDFVIPIIHDGVGGKKSVREVRVEYATPWVAKFRRAVESAYGNSPYYIYYSDEFWRIFEGKPEKLWDLNAKVTEFLCAKIGIAPEIVPTREFGAEGKCWDLREVIHPKRENNVMAEMGVGRPYWQVFREKFGFVGGLSVLDLLFNEGPESLGYLR